MEGPFSCLPAKVIHIAVSYMDLISILSLNNTSHYFHKICTSRDLWFVLAGLQESDGIRTRKFMNGLLSLKQKGWWLPRKYERAIQRCRNIQEKSSKKKLSKKSKRKSVFKPFKKKTRNTKHLKKMDPSSRSHIPMPPEFNETNLIKMVFVGDDSVGKTNLTLRWNSKRYEPSYIPTTEDSHRKTLLNGGVVDVFDISQTTLLNNKSGAYYCNLTNVYMCCFSLQEEKTIETLTKDTLPIIDTIGSKIQVLVGCKKDERNYREVDALKLAMQRDIPYISTSAKHNVNVDAAFRLGFWSYFLSNDIGTLDKIMHQRGGTLRIKKRKYKK